MLAKKNVSNNRRMSSSRFDVVVVGGGLAGVCAAIALARHGCKAALVQDRPVLGGNSSSEIRVPPSGANVGAWWARETGIIEEIMLNDRSRNHDPVWVGTMNSLWDMSLYEAVRAEPNITLHLNTSIHSVEMRDKNTIKCVLGIQSMSERTLKLYAKYFIDCTGDATVGACAGAKFRYGREARKEFGESLAPLKADNKTQGSTLLFRAYDIGYPVRFSPPAWSKNYKTPDSLYMRKNWIRIRRVNGKREYCGYWWIEVGAPFNTIDDNEKIRDEILRHLMGVWDYIKNYGSYNADNFVIDWLGMVPGKRESRRLAGDYILKQQDLFEQTEFPDRIAYGGWNIDVHTMGGILAKNKPPERLGANPDLEPERSVSLYSIPLRSLYSKNIRNLFMAGRNISATHIALGSTRLMLTCAIMGQAAGTAAAMCINKKVPPKTIAVKHIYQLQQQLLKDDCFIHDMPSTDKKDLARTANVRATSESPLILEPLNRELPANIYLSQAFPVSEKRIETIGLHLHSKNRKNARMEIELLRISDIWAFNEKSPVIPIISSANIPVGYKGWIDFNIDADIKPGLYRINISPLPDVYLTEASPVPGVAYSYRKPHWKRYVYARQVLSMKLTPLSFAFGPENVVNGVARPEKWPNIWISDPCSPLPQSITLNFGKPVKFNTVYLTFDTMLMNDFRNYSVPHGIKECVNAYEITAVQHGNPEKIVEVTGNFQRRRIHRFKTVNAESLEIKILSTNGDKSARIYEIRVYNE